MPPTMIRSLGATTPGWPTGWPAWFTAWPSTELGTIMGAAARAPAPTTDFPNPRREIDPVSFFILTVLPVPGETGGPTHRYAFRLKGVAHLQISGDFHFGYPVLIF